MLSAASGPLSGWVAALPAAPSNRLSDGDVVLATRHLLGLCVATTLSKQLYQCGDTDIES